jgi:hypothetical protein
MSKKKMFKFNVKNVRYSVPVEGVYGVIKDLAYANSISLEADYNEIKLHGDGQILAVLGDDKGKTGTLSVINIEKDYELDMKRALEVDAGLADVQQRGSVAHALYFETDAIEDGVPKTVKHWLFGVTTGKASETYEQTQDDPTINPYEYPLTVLGVNLKNNLGTADYKDANGNTVKVFRVTSFPGDTGYDTFDDTVPEPSSLV